MMKMKLDKDMTPVSRVKDVKDAMKEFKNKYTEGDLAREYRDAFDIYQGYGYDILQTEIDAYWDYCTASTHYAVDMILYQPHIAFVTYRFYCHEEDGILKISEDSLLRDVTTYRKERNA